MKDDSSNSYSKPHLRFDAFSYPAPYSRPKKDLSGITSKRDRSHGGVLVSDYKSAILKAHESSEHNPAISESPRGAYLELSLDPESQCPELNWPSKGIRISAIHEDAQNNLVGSLYIPLGSEDFIEEKIVDYAEKTDKNDRPKNESDFAPINSFKNATASSLWTDKRPFPEEGKAVWWECWCVSKGSEATRRTAKKLGLPVEEQSLKFPDVEVITVYADSSGISKLVHNTNAILELRHADDTPYTFSRMHRGDQVEWINDLLDRIEAPDSLAPKVCILDHGVNSANPLLAPAIGIENCHSLREDWGTHDHHGHGTNMAGAALYGDLTYPLADRSNFQLMKRLESVKILPPPGWSANNPLRYGILTQDAVSTVETDETRRVYCMAVTSHCSGESPTSWSAAIDQICSGATIGDLDEHGKPASHAARRLFVVSAGNIPDTVGAEYDLHKFPIEDPAQAWNAITVGGYTNKTNLLQHKDLAGYMPMAEPGELSPYSRASLGWKHSRTAIKPEVVFEAGNRAISPINKDIVSGVESLSTLSTSRDFTRSPLEHFWATSSATAQAAGMIADIISHHPNLWPETIRALLIHSAQWTQAMLTAISKCKSKKDAIILVRQFGYGVPDLKRALSSASNDLAMISEAEISPFERRRNAKGQLSPPSFNEIHYYDLPWPKSELEKLENKKVQLKITLSYFVEPSPADLGMVIPQRYQSHGLRFDLKKKSETIKAFKARINDLEKDKSAPKPAKSGQTSIPDPGWTFGPKSIAAGSIHCDIWTGPAIELAARDKIAVYPVSGWWRYRNHLKRFDTKTRYALVLSISSDDENINLYAEIESKINIDVDINASISI